MNPPKFEAVKDILEEVKLGVDKGFGEWIHDCTLGYLTSPLECGGLYVALKARLLSLVIILLCAIYCMV